MKLSAYDLWLILQSVRQQRRSGSSVGTETQPRRTVAEPARTSVEPPLTYLDGFLKSSIFG